MITHIVAILLILGIAYLQMKQGLFSSLVMAVCAVFSTALAMTLYQAISSVTQLYDVQPSLADSISVGMLFGGSLLGLRVLADKFISGDIYFNLVVERIGGAVFGLLSGMLMVGALLVVIQLAPFGAVIYHDFQPFQDSLLRGQRISPLYPDDLVVGLGEFLSSGSMRGGKVLGQEHDNLLQEAFCARNTAGLGGRLDPGGNAVRDIRGYYWGPKDLSAPENPMIPRNVATKLIVLRTAVNVCATDEGNAPYWWRLPATHFRLLCREGREEEYRSYYPLTYVYYDENEKKVKLAEPPKDADGNVESAKVVVERPGDTGVYDEKEKYGQGTIPEDKINLYVDWVYRIPSTASPQTLYFRRTDAVKVSGLRNRFDPEDPKQEDILRYMLRTKPAEERR